MSRKHIYILKGISDVKKELREANHPIDIANATNRLLSLFMCLEEQAIIDELELKSQLDNIVTNDLKGVA